MSQPSGTNDNMVTIACKDTDGECICPVAELASQPDRMSASLDQAFESAAVGMGLLDLHGHWIRVNRSFCELLGLEKTEILHKSFLAITHANDINLCLRLYRQLASGEIDNYNLEKRYLHKSGSAVWALITISLVRCADGSPAFVTAQIQDVTKRKQAEESLRRSEAMFRSIGENAGDLILVVDYPGLIAQYASPTYETLLGYPVDEVEGQSCLGLVHPDDHPRILQAVTAMVTQGGDGAIFEIRVRSKNGAWHYVETHACAVRGASGDIERFVAISRIIDNRILAEQELKDQKEQLQLLLDSTAEAIYGLDFEGRYTFCNKACLRLLGYESESEVLGKNSHHLIHHSHSDGSPYSVEDCAVHNSLLTGKQTHATDDIVWRVDGTCVPVEYWSHPVRRNGELVGCVVTLIDISESKAAEKALFSAHEQSTLFINSVPSILIGMDTQGRVTRWNFTAAATFERPEPEVLGKPLFQCGIRWRRQDMQAEVQSWCQQRERRRYDDVPFERNGQTRLLGLTINWMEPLHGDDGELLIVASDTTEKRDLEEQLRQAQKLEAIGQLAAGIAHEINTPTQYVGDNTNFLKESWTSIAPLLSAAQQLRLAVSHGTVPPATLEQFDSCRDAADLEYLQQEIPRAIDQSLEGIQRVTKIVRAMKEFSHPGNGEKREVDINKAIETTFTVARNEWKYVAEVETHLTVDLPLVPCHSGEFNQVILNLVINAAHALAKGHGDGTHAKGKITVSTERDGAGVKISLHDNGTGIPEGIRSRVFDPFFTTKPVGQGTGQGLALAHNTIVRRHGGKIWFDTEVGKGTTFFIWLPLAAATAE